MSEDNLEDIDASPADDAASGAEVTVRGPGVSITRAVDEQTMARVIALLFSAEPFVAREHLGGPPRDRSGSLGTAEESAASEKPPTWDDRTTLGEFLTDSGAKTFPQKICATGYFLTVVKGANDFSRDEVKSALLGAREDMPGNFGRDWSHATSMSLIASESGDPERFYIPRTGRTAVESHFQEAPKRRARRATKKSSPSANGDAE